MTVIEEFSVEQPINLEPPNDATGVSVTPFLQASAFFSDLVVQEKISDGAPGMVVNLAVSRDGVVFGPDVPRSLGEFGKYAERVNWNDPGGLGKYESYMGLRLRTNAPVAFTPDALFVDIANAKNS